MMAATRLVTRAFPLARSGPAMQKRTMVSLKDLSNRMTSVGAVRKITSSMKTVAASKLKGAEGKLVAMRPFYQAAASLMVESNALVPCEDPEDLKVFGENDAIDKKHLVVTINSDKGLCGSINSTIGKQANFWLGQLPNDLKASAAVGSKGVAALTRGHATHMNYAASDFDKTPFKFADVLPVADAILTSAEFDRLDLFTNEHVNMLTFNTLRKSYISPAEMGEMDLSAYDFEDSQPAVLKDYYEWHFASLLYASLVDNQAAELGARMTSMDNATRNAGDMLSALSIKFNRQRQAAITTELTEIISGAESVKVTEDD
eukprot:TRINITY_DN8963_c0_g1_i1.p1 TRINITY_DN8963_c0_g1~~TRINITY_DN8963_c0_g1_i1.p1  ORF type:complete len:317 (-),score=77.69 TRINITY_DN8963_c0_g1_i1:97-1047(-)